MSTTFPLAIWTADNTPIKADTVFFTADGQNLINGGGIAIFEAPNQENNSLSVTVAGILPL